MARGITESDVHTAADEIVAVGERPTVERIRAHLRTGSPNTVTRWLETWWQGLGSRLQTQHQRMGVPEAPEAVMALAGEWWALALEHARAAAEQTLATDRAALQGEIEALQREREAFLAEATTLRDRVSVASHAQQLAAAQSAELQRLVSRLEGQLEEATQQRNAAVARTADAETSQQVLEARIQALQDAAQSERESFGQHMRAVEDRAYKEIDRARQEAKELHGKLASVTGQATTAEKALRELLEQANMKATEANREAGAQRARADALEGQLAGLRDLPAVLEAAIRRSDTKSAPRKSGGKGKGAESPQSRPPLPKSSQRPRQRRAKLAE